MPAEELMLLHGATGGNTMPSRTSGYTSYFDPVSGRYVRRATRRRRSRRVSGLGSLGSFGQAVGFKGTLASIKGVLITGAIAAAGAIATDRIYDMVGAKLNLAGWQRDLAKIATGIGLALIIAKLLKKPKLAAAFAIGPVVAGGIRLFSDLMGTPQTAGLGLTSFMPSSAYESMYSPLYGDNLGLNTYEPVGAPDSAFAPPPPMSGYYSMPASV